MKKILIVLALYITHCFSQVTFVDTLLDQSIARTVDWEIREDMIKRVRTLDTTKQIEVFHKLALVSYEDRADAIGELFRLQDTLALGLLSTYKDSLYKGGWELIAQYLRRNEWRLAEINDSLLNYLASSENEEIIEGIFTHFSYRMLYSDIEKLWILKQETENSNVRLGVYTYISEYKSDKTDEWVTTILQKPFENYHGTIAMIYSLPYSNRYDFIEQLMVLKSNLKNEVEPLKKDVAIDIISEIDDVIPQLEKAKAERRKIGKPLDWGLDFPTKESEEEERKNKQAQEAAAKEEKAPATGINLDWGLDK